MVVEHKRVCINKFLGRCPDCIPDDNPHHHPNNLDCPKYKPTTIIYFYVSRNGEGTETRQNETEGRVEK